MKKVKPRSGEEPEELNEDGEEIEGEPEKLGPYDLIEEMPRSEHSRGELYRARHEESGATALVLKPGAGESEALSDLKARYVSSASPRYVAVEVEEVPWAHAPRKPKMEELVHAFEALHAGVERLGRLLWAAEPRSRRHLMVALAASVAAVCALLLVGAGLVATRAEVPSSTDTAHTRIEGASDDVVSQETSLLAEPLPEDPFEGQKLAPCRRPIQVELIGACWVPHEMKAPCPRGLYEHQGECYVPVLDALPSSQAERH